MVPLPRFYLLEKRTRLEVLAVKYRHETCQLVPRQAIDPPDELSFHVAMHIFVAAIAAIVLYVAESVRSVPTRWLCTLIIAALQHGCFFFVLKCMRMPATRPLVADRILPL